jgi:hypothetical protein
MNPYSDQLIGSQGLKVLGCANRDAAREIPPTAIDVRLVPIESGGALTAAIVCLPRSVGLDG